MIIFLDIETINTNPINQDHINKYLEKINFMPELNEIFTICVGYKLENGLLNIINIKGNEEEQINEFFRIIKGNVLCGFNIKKFDIPFIVKRALYYNIKIPDELKIYGKKPREINNIIDLQEVYSYGVFGSIGDTDLICNHLGIDNPKTEEINGGKVQRLYEDGKLEEIIEYCKRDVKSTINMYEKFLELNLI